MNFITKLFKQKPKTPIDWSRFLWVEWKTAQLFGESIEKLLWNYKQNIIDTMGRANKQGGKLPINEETQTGMLLQKMMTELSNISTLRDPIPIDQIYFSEKRIKYTPTEHWTTTVQIDNLHLNNLQGRIKITADWWKNGILPIKIWNKPFFLENESHNRSTEIYLLWYNHIAKVLLENNEEYQKDMEQYKTERESKEQEKRNHYDKEHEDYVKQLQEWEENNISFIIETEQAIEDLTNELTEAQKNQNRALFHELRYQKKNLSDNLNKNKPKEPTPEPDVEINYTEAFEKYYHGTTPSITVEIFRSPKEINTIIE